MQLEGQLKNPAKHLFIWAVLMNRMSLAKLFWRIGSDHIGINFFLIVVRKAYFTDKCFTLELKLPASAPQPGKKV